MMQHGFRITTGRQARRPAETLVPMINIVFLLLIFFLLSATVAPPDPFDLRLPDAAVEGDASVQGPAVLHVSAEGELAFRDLRDEAALMALAALFQAADAAPKVLVLRVDAAVDGAAFAALLTRLNALGASGLSLTVNQR